MLRASRNLTSSRDETTTGRGLADTEFVIDPNTLPAWEGTPPASAVADVREALDLVADEAESGPLNITTRHDIYRYVQLLLNGEVVIPEVGNESLGILKQQMVVTDFPTFRHKTPTWLTRPATLTTLSTILGSSGHRTVR